MRCSIAKTKTLALRGDLPRSKLDTDSSYETFSAYRMEGNFYPRVQIHRALLMRKTPSSSPKSGISPPRTTTDLVKPPKRGSETRVFPQPHYPDQHYSRSNRLSDPAYIELLLLS